MELRNKIHAALNSNNSELAIALWSDQAALCEAHGDATTANVCRANIANEKLAIARRKATKTANFDAYLRLIREGMRPAEALIAAREI